MNAVAKSSFDVVGLGCTAMDELLYVPCFPEKDAKVQVERSLRRLGGLTGIALVTAARLGGRTAFAGCLGVDEASEYVARKLSEDGVDISHAPRLPAACVVRSTIVVSRDGSRNVFYQIEGKLGADDALPPDEVILGARVVFIDQWGMTGNLRAVRLARAAGVAVVADFEDSSAPKFGEVLQRVDHLVLSRGFAERITGRQTPGQAAEALWHPERAAVIVTAGDQGCWSIDSDTKGVARHHPPFAVKATDTTGCGDVFHGAYALSLARGDPLETRIQFASAAAAIKAERNLIPNRAMLEAFLEERTGSPKRTLAPENAQAPIAP